MTPKHADPTMEQVLRRLDQDAVYEFSVSVEPRLPGSPDFLNAYGVCLLRLGKVYEALTVLNEIALNPDTLRVRSDIPDSFKVNLATARLLARNPSGCLQALRTVRNKKNQYYRQLRRTIRDWSRSLPLLLRLIWRLGVLSRTPIRLDFTPGELNGETDTRGQNSE